MLLHLMKILISINWGGFKGMLQIDKAKRKFIWRPFTDMDIN